ncbi:MAG: hypothetical protein PUC44_08205 [Eubacteriales bacterium]|nr:hypothetical protein [Eubacteriales bacterium]
MAFLDKLKETGNTLKDTGASVVAKGSETVAVTKLKGKIVNENKAIDGIYAAIGKTVFEKCTADDSEIPEQAKAYLPEDVQKQFDEIKERQEKIAGFEAEIEQVKNN